MKGIRPRCQQILQSALHLRGSYGPLPIATPSTIVTARRMSSQREASIPHELRTAAEPRQNRLYPVRLSHVEQINPSIRLLQLAIPEESNDDTQQPFSFLPGQWLDVHIPSIAQAGGFTITSTPADAQLLPSPETSPDAEIEAPASSQGRPPYVELAVQDSPSNPPAAWLWKPKEEILGKKINIRVGGSFVWPPTGIDTHKIKNLIFIAGGVGINPLISILSHLNNQTQTDSHQKNIHFFYSTRLPKGQDSTPTDAALDQILFLPRLRQIIHSQLQAQRLRISLDLFLTNSASTGPLPKTPSDLVIHPRRISEHDLHLAVKGTDGTLDPRDTICYVCGPPQMTDEMVESLKGILGDNGEQRIFFEKWW